MKEAPGAGEHSLDDCQLAHCIDCDACEADHQLKIGNTNLGRGYYLVDLCTPCWKRRWVRGQLRLRHQRKRRAGV